MSMDLQAYNHMIECVQLKITGQGDLQAYCTHKQLAVDKENNTNLAACSLAVAPTCDADVCRRRPWSSDVGLRRTASSPAATATYWREACDELMHRAGWDPSSYKVLDDNRSIDLGR